jgi:hypothetical protein
MMDQQDFALVNDKDGNGKIDPLMNVRHGAF